MERPTRKPNRLPEYDYSQNGAYFVTICTGDKQNLFLERRRGGYYPPANEG